MRRFRIITIMFMIAMGSLVNESLGNDEDDRVWIVMTPGTMVTSSSKIFVGEVQSVAWAEKPKVAGRSGKAMFLVRKGIRGCKTGERIVLPVHEVNPAQDGTDPPDTIWEERKFVKGSVWLFFWGPSTERKNTAIGLLQIKSMKEPLIQDVIQAVKVDDMKPEEKIKSLRAVLQGKSLKSTLMVNYAISEAGRLTLKYPDACRLLLAVAAESTNTKRIRLDALNAMDPHIANAKDEDRSAWLKELRLFLEAAPKFRQTPLELLDAYTNGLYSTLRQENVAWWLPDAAAWKKLQIPADLKLTSPKEVKEALVFMAGKFDASVPALEEKLRLAKSPKTTFDAKWRRKQKISKLESFIAEREKQGYFLAALATLIDKTPTSLPATDAK